MPALVRFALALVALATALVADGAMARDWKRIRIALDGAYPPFSRTTAGGVEGFDVEVADAVCVRLGAECERVVTGWDDLLVALLSRRVDLVVASVPITEELRRRVEFTQRYHRVAPRFVGCAAAAPRPLLPATLAGLRVGVRAGTAHAVWLADTHPAAARAEFASEAEAGAALLDGRLDLVFGDTVALFDWLDRAAPRGRCGFVGDEVIAPRHFGAGAGIVYRREDRDLGQLVDRALLDLTRDGTLDRLAAHWFAFAIR